MAKGFKGGGMPGNMGALLQQAQQMQKNLEKAQEKAKTMTAEATVGGGMVTVVAKGNNEIESITISPDVIDPEDPEILQDLILSGVNESLRKVQAEVQGELGKATGGMNIPNLF